MYGSSDTATDVADGADVYEVTTLQTMLVALGHTLMLDGQAGADTYTVTTTGSTGLQAE